MIKVKFKGFSHLTDGETELRLEASNVLEIFEAMKERYPLFKNKMFNPKTGRIYPEMLIIINGKPVYDYTRRLKDGDVVEIWPVFAGG